MFFSRRSVLIVLRLVLCKACNIWLMCYNLWDLYASSDDLHSIDVSSLQWDFIYTVVGKLVLWDFVRFSLTQFLYLTYNWLCMAILRQVCHQIMIPCLMAEHMRTLWALLLAQEHKEEIIKNSNRSIVFIRGGHPPPLSGMIDSCCVSAYIHKPAGGASRALPLWIQQTDYCASTVFFDGSY